VSASNCHRLLARKVGPDVRSTFCDPTNTNCQPTGYEHMTIRSVPHMIHAIDTTCRAKREHLE
jgi:hypothetical protein